MISSYRYMDEKKNYSKLPIYSNLLIVIIFFLFIFVIYFSLIFNINREPNIYNSTLPILCYRECKNKIKCNLINKSYKCKLINYFNKCNLNNNSNKCNYCNINNTTFDNYGIKTVYCS